MVETVVPAPEPGPRTASHPGKVREDWTPDLRCAPSGVTKRAGAGATLFRAYRARGHVCAFRGGVRFARLIARARQTQGALRLSAESGSFRRRTGAKEGGPRMPLPSSPFYHGYSEVKPCSGIITRLNRQPLLQCAPYPSGHRWKPMTESGFGDGNEEPGHLLLPGRSGPTCHPGRRGAPSRGPACRGLCRAAAAVPGPASVRGDSAGPRLLPWGSQRDRRWRTSVFVGLHGMSLMRHPRENGGSPPQDRRFVFPWMCGGSGSVEPPGRSGRGA